MTDLAPAAARALIDRSRYMTLATADADGRPWVSPVWFAHDDYAEFLWVSRPDARHSLNTEARRCVALVVFDSSAAPQDAQAVYVEAEVEQADGETLDRAVGVYSDKSVRTGLNAWSAADVSGAAPHRCTGRRRLLRSCSQRTTVASRCRFRRMMDGVVRSVDYSEGEAARGFASPLGGAELSAMFRLRTLVLLWLGRKLWAHARPALERRLRRRHKASR